MRNKLIIVFLLTIAFLSASLLLIIIFSLTIPAKQKPERIKDMRRMPIEKTVKRKEVFCGTGVTACYCEEKLKVSFPGEFADKTCTYTPIFRSKLAK